MYNYTLQVNYKNNNDEDQNYRKLLLNAFHLEQYDNDKIMNKMKLIYNIIKNNDKIKSIIQLLKKYKYSSIFIINDNEPELYLIFLFSFEYFDLFHKCLQELHFNNTITELSYNNLYNELNKNIK
tara:strand:- start:1014 stop:1388 length:375 start_codon:yes stop_codon:yes gene_type:complete